LTLATESESYMHKRVTSIWTSTVMAILWKIYMHCTLILLL